MTSTVLPIWITDTFRPVRVRAIEGVAEILSGLDIIGEPDITVVFGRNHFRVGQGELEMMTYNEGNRWVFHLSPTDFAYDKLHGYFRKMQKGELGVLQVQGDFGRHLEVRKVTKSKSQKLQGVGSGNRLFRK